MVFRGLLAAIEGVVLGRPRLVLALALASVAVALALGSQVEIRTSRADLAPPDDPDQLRWNELVADYGASAAVIAVVEAETGAASDPSAMRRFTDRLAGNLERDPLVADVFHRVDVDWIRRNGVYLAPPAEIEAAAAAIAGSAAAGRLGEATDLARLHDLVSDELERGARGGAATAVPGGAERGLDALATFLAWERELLTDPRRTLERLTARAPLEALAGPLAGRLGDGYLATRDGSTLFAVVTPVDTGDDLPGRRALLARMREVARDAAGGVPGFRVGFTGTPAMAVEEMDIVRRDTWKTSAVAAVGVCGLTFLVFRRRTHALCVLAALAVGLAWSWGAVWLELGYLNLITSAFVSTLAGVGVAYGIHPVAEYELVLPRAPSAFEAVRQAWRRTSAAVAAAAVTTAVAFFSILLMRFRGFDELGLVAGVGVLLCLAAMVLVLPALLVLHGRRAGADPGTGRVPLDRLGFEPAIARTCRHPGAVLVGAAVLTVAGAVVARGIGFDANLLDLLPRDADSVRLQRKLVTESELAPVVNFVVAGDLDELRAMRERAEAEPSIARFDSALSLLPPDLAASERGVRDLRAALEALRLPPATTGLDPERLAASLVRLEEACATAAEGAFASGLGTLAAALDRAATHAAEAADVARRADAETVAAWNEAQATLLTWVSRTRGELVEATRGEPPGPGSLPDELRARFFTRTGQPLGVLVPAGSVFESEPLAAYDAASRRVSETAVGFPLLLHKASGRITRGFFRAVLAGGVLVLLTLLIDLRSVRDALLAAVPLAMGMVWTAAGMRLAGIDFNFANLVAMPLVIGVGIDNGVHVMHRVRLEGDSGIATVLAHTGRAILIASLTTMIGFGSLALASHRGLSSLGIALLLGVGSCFLTSVVVLPNLLVALGIVRR
jgi:predicted RND superfamily exporter protein